MYVDNDSTINNDERLEQLREQGPQLAAIKPSPGMGIVFDNSQPESEEYGGRLAEVKTVKGGLLLRIHRAKSKARASSCVQVGQRVWLNHAPQLIKKQRRGTTDRAQYELITLAVDIHVYAQSGHKLALTLN